MPGSDAKTPPPDRNALRYASLLLEHHDLCTDGPPGDYPGSDQDRREFDRLTNAMYQAMGQPVRVVNANHAQALYTARTLMAIVGPGGAWHIEVLDIDAQSPTCGDWIANPDLTGPDTDDAQDATNRALALFAQGHTTQVVWVTRKPFWTSMMPWQRTPGTATRHDDPAKETPAC